MQRLVRSIRHNLEKMVASTGSHRFFFEHLLIRAFVVPLDSQLDDRLQAETVDKIEQRLHFHRVAMVGAPATIAGVSGAVELPSYEQGLRRIDMHYLHHNGQS